MKRHWRNWSHDDEGEGLPDSDSDTRSSRRFSLTRLMAIFLFSLFLFSLIFLLPHPPIQSASTAKTLHQFKQTQQGNVADSVELHKDKLLGGLIADGFDEQSCLSRYHSVTYSKGLSGNPSSYLISRLRKYEALHKECGPYTESYNKTVKDLRSGHVNRVLLVDPGVDMVDLFCEPLPHVSWFLPPDFPLNSQFPSFDQKSDQCYGKMLKNKSATNSVVPSFVYLHLAHDYDDQDKLFFCDDDQAFLQKVPWLVVRTDNYFAPSLFLMPSFEKQLSDLFPNKETVFHFLGRYLFHPTNKVWGLVSRYYQAYLADVDERVGIQIRVFDTRTGPFQHVLDQILACTLKENLLPDVNQKGDIVNSPGKPKSKAVLMTSLSYGYFEKVRDMFWEHPTVTGEVVGIYQPSHEGYQQTEKKMHNQKAWAEIYLLSLMDMLVTSSWSTFGYVAQGLGGLKPWILYKPENGTAPDPPCQRAMSMEPCFHAPPFYDCKAKRGTDTGALVPHVRHCEDMSWGLKLVDSNSWQ
ncbi:hypothetical protein GLYMA_04G166600v4 [Glycine max]|uniref:Fucosyltransferase n=1 Tax=Glycine max TaxID=3847 RepID=A0A0R0K954_SOYBN|nr:hypothetical protein GYH30_010178 [Glycine max]KRH63302.1 hypothetical protein GLYMA_04G166600v4 [Glycine max]